MAKRRTVQAGTKKKTSGSYARKMETGLFMYGGIVNQHRWVHVKICDVAPHRSTNSRNAAGAASLGTGLPGLMRLTTTQQEQKQCNH